MGPILWVIIATLVAVLILGVIGIRMAIKNKACAKPEETYKAFYRMGLIFFPVGLVWVIISIVTDIPVAVGLPLFTMGIIYLAIGLSNKSKWQKTE